MSCYSLKAFNIKYISWSYADGSSCKCPFVNVFLSNIGLLLSVISGKFLLLFDRTFVSLAVLDKFLNMFKRIYFFGK